MKIGLSVLLLALLVGAPLAQAKLARPAKVGIGTWESDKLGTMLKQVESFKFGWYYDWRTDHLYSPLNTQRTVPFVPMIWDEQHVYDSFPRTSGVLLGFNEPDNSTQAAMSVETAIALWPKLVAKKMRLGSPAVTTGQTLAKSGWLGRFMEKAKAQNLRVDFMAVHYYAETPDVAAFKKFLDQTYQAYGRPIWVTEWALVDWNNPGRYSYEDTAAFAKAALVMLDAHPRVERHAWFSGLSDGSGIHTELIDDKNELTPVGRVFWESLR